MTWSGTPWRLRSAMAQQCTLVDLDASVRSLARTTLRLAWARRHQGLWRSMWQHGRSAQRLVEHRLARSVSSAKPDAVLEIQDIGVIDRPYFVLQDLSYDLLLDHFGDGGVPHFRGLSRRRILELRDRQLRVYESAAGLLPMSRWLANRLIASGVAPERITVVNPGMNVPLGIELPAPDRRVRDTRRLLFIGRDFETKGGHQVVAAYRLLRREMGPSISLTIAGPRRWPLPGIPPEGVHFLGPVPASAVHELYDSHDLFVMPSLFEGFGIAFAEALARGLPCIGRDRCAMPEIIDPPNGGRLVSSEDPSELAETIVKTLVDDALYEQCLKAAPHHRTHYTWQRAATEILSAMSRR